MKDNQSYQKETEVVLKGLGSTREGIRSLEAQKRLAEFGPNELQEKKKKTILLMLLDQFKDFMILVLIGAAIIAGIIGEPADTLVIIAIVIINAIIGFIQEYRAEKAMGGPQEDGRKRCDGITGRKYREGGSIRTGAGRCGYA